MAGPGKDFASLLNEIMAESEAQESAQSRASVDYLSVMEELHSGRIKFSEERVRAEYGDAAHEPPPEPAVSQRVQLDPPSIDPADVAKELGLHSGRKPADLDRVRRDFAFRNHPDRVEATLRERAMVRMQIANMLIDEAKTGQRKR